MRWWLVVAIACGHTATPPAPDACQPSVVFLDQNGGHYDHGFVDDATANLSVVVAAPLDLPPWPSTAPSWSEVSACIRDGLAPFAVAVTEIDPGTAPHVELVFTTSYWAGPAGTTSIVPNSCRRDQIGFVFGDAAVDSVRACQIALIALAELVAQLSFDDNCADFINPANDCTPMRSFVDATATCVDTSDRPTACRCGGGTTQNTFRAMSAAFAPCP